jgi:hypothetical protein
MAAIYKERAETVGLGKAKADFISVLIGNDNLTTSNTDEDSGTPETLSWSTGATIDDPYGLQLVSIAIMMDKIGVGSGGTLLLDAYAQVNDPDAEGGEGIQRADNWEVPNVAQLTEAGDGVVSESGTYGAPKYRKTEFDKALFQRVFVAPTLNLELVHFINVTSNSDVTIATAKFVFKKVKMTKNAYLEKLAIRAYG